MHLLFSSYFAIKLHFAAMSADHLWKTSYWEILSKDTAARDAVNAKKDPLVRMWPVFLETMTTEHCINCEITIQWCRSAKYLEAFYSQLFIYFFAAQHFSTSIA